MFYKYVIGIIAYMFPPEVVAKVAVMLFKKVASKTTWTDADDELAKILEDRLKGNDL